MSYYQKHLFFCINQRVPGKQCCQNNNASDFMAYAKQCLRDRDLLGKGKIRVSSSGCLGRCAEGPVLVIYPESVWYRYESRSDIDQIIQKHVIENDIVTELLLE